MTMTEKPTRRSPLHAALHNRGAKWQAVGDGVFAVQLREEPHEWSAATSVGICDLSGLAKVSLIGQHVADRLRQLEIEVPVEIFDSQPLAGGGRLVKIGTHEYFLEDGIGDTAVLELADQVIASSKNEVVRVERQEATIMLVGTLSSAVLAQTCGINFQEAPDGRVIFTRVAGVSCSLLPDPLDGSPAYRIWADPSYARSLWGSLLEISESLGGGAIGVGRLFPDVLPKG